MALTKPISKWRATSKKLSRQMTATDLWKLEKCRCTQYASPAQAEQEMDLHRAERHMQDQDFLYYETGTAATRNTLMSTHTWTADPWATILPTISSVRKPAICLEDYGNKILWDLAQELILKGSHLRYTRELYYIQSPSTQSKNKRVTANRCYQVATYYHAGTL